MFKLTITQLYDYALKNIENNVSDRLTCFFTSSIIHNLM